MEGVTESLRRSAPQWSLAGDKELLDALQTLHQRIMEKCQETNRRLDEMVSALDDASVHLQNVNNKFTALSNNQFIESRVYDDDPEDTTDTATMKEQPTQNTRETEMEKLRHSLQVLEDFHETVTILCDSDDSSDEEDNVTSVVLKPKDLYSHRPLPYVIGSQSWRSKWHAGLVQDESDSDSDRSKPQEEQYSESDNELWCESPQQRPARDRTISSSSADLHSEHEAGVVPAAVPALSQADVAAELAKRLGGDAQKMPQQDEDYTVPQPTVRKVYKPEVPTATQIFSDEPPPLEFEESEESETDIFAEINRNQPYKRSGRDQNSVTDDLFKNPEDPPKPVAKQKSPLFGEESEPELFVEKPKPQEAPKVEEIAVKKPVGGKSLFGANAESIGAAILNRKQRQSTSDEESDSSEPQIKNVQPPGKSCAVEKAKVTKEDSRSKERDIFDDLFARSEKINKENKEKVPETKKDEKNKEIKKVDLFKTDLFDDIDDIFTTNVVSKVKTNDKREKSIFDEEEDDLFADVTVADKNVAKANEKSIFDSDKNIFSNQTKVDTKLPKVNDTVKEKSIFDDDDDDLFSDIPVTKAVTDTKASAVIVTATDAGIDSKKVDLFGDNSDDELFKNQEVVQKPNVAKEKPKLVINEPIGKDTKERIKTTPKPLIMNSPNIFDDDEIDDLFTSKSKVGSNGEKTYNSITDENNGTSKSSAEINVNDVSLDINKVNKKEIAKPKNASQEDKNDNFEVATKPVIPTKPEVTQTADNDSKDLGFDPELKPKSGTFSPKSAISDDIFDDNPDGDDIFKASQAPVASYIAASAATVIFDKIETKENDIEETISKTNISDSIPDAYETKQALNNTNVSNNKLDPNEQINKDVNADVQQKDVKGTDDIFTEIFDDQPPIFEKPKEPKKSKNVNALFDDDSDDETLFFKKNDPLLDEKPELFTTHTEDRLFGLFINEPPAIDVDFVQKSPKKEETNTAKETIDNIDNITPNIEDSSNDNLDQKSVKKEENISINKVHTNQDVNKDIFTSTKTPETKTDLFDKEDIFSDLNDDDLFKPKESKKDDTLHSTEVDLAKVDTDTAIAKKPEVINKEDKTETTHKKIGKLKPMNFNINVNTLLPGASPKKVAKHVDDTDTTNNIVKSNEELRSNDTEEQVDSKMVKSVSFEGKPDSKILDNSLSKDRAKIQVKRRPSTRRARREAVKKSGIDFGEDTTDNSTSDDIKASEENTSERTDTDVSLSYVPAYETKLFERNNDEVAVKGIISSVDVTSSPILKDETDFEENTFKVNKSVDFESPFADNNTVINKFDDFNKELESSNIRTTEINDIFDPDTGFDASVNERVNITEEKALEQPVEVPKDPEINNEAKKIESNVKSKVVYILNDEDIFNTKADTSRIDTDDDLFKNKPINTLGKVYKKDQITEPVTKATVLDSDDENLFKTNRNSKKESTDTPKPSIFDSDDDTELFTKKTVDKEIKTVLFASDSDEELFGKKRTEKDREIKRDKEKSVEREIKKVDVKANLFGDDDDDDLFGVKSKKTVEPKPQTSKTTREVSKPAEIVFADPLSLLGDSD